MTKSKYISTHKCPYVVLFWSIFSPIRIEYGEIQSISPDSVRMLENADQNNSEYGHFLRIDSWIVYPGLRSCGADYIGETFRNSDKNKTERAKHY